MAATEDNDATGRRNTPRETDDRLLDELLRQIEVDVLDEPVPDMLRRALYPGGRPDDGSTAGPGRGQPTRRDERSTGRNGRSG